MESNKFDCMVAEINTLDFVIDAEMVDRDELTGVLDVHFESGNFEKLKACLNFKYDNIQVDDPAGRWTWVWINDW